MEATLREQVIAKDGEIRLTGLPYKRGEVVEIIILPEVHQVEARPRLTVRQLRESGLIGLWKDRADIEDSKALPVSE